MNSDIIKGNWKIAKSKIKEAWADLTEDELTQSEASSDALVGTIQKKYGYTKDKAQSSVNEFLEKFNQNK